MTRLKIPNMETALKLYYGAQSGVELTNANIRELFGCSSSTANRLKKEVIAEQEKRAVKSISSSAVNTKIAYEVWGINIVEIERRYIRGKKIWKEG